MKFFKSMNSEQLGLLSHELRKWIQTVLLIAGGVFTLYAFLYKEIIVPSNLPVSLKIKASMDLKKKNEDSAFVLTKIAIINESNKTIYTPAIWFNIYGIKLENTDPDYLAIVTNKINMLNSRAHSFDRLSQFTTQKIVETIGTGFIHTARDSAKYYPKGASENDYLFLAPTNNYDAILLSAALFQSKEEYESIKIEWHTSPIGNIMPDNPNWEIYEDLLFNRATSILILD